MSRARTEWLNVYRPTFSRALNSYVINGFFARELEADDFEFLEQVKLRGIANGSVPSYSAGTEEELAYWQLPYEMDTSVPQRFGPVETRGVGETPEQREQRRAAWRAKIARRDADKAEALAELAREEQAWREAQRGRRVF